MGEKMMRHPSFPAAVSKAMLAFTACLVGAAPAQGQVLFQTADRCIACHNGLISPAGEDVSLGFNWRPSMMANAVRDPYWQAAVRREIMDHPQAQAAIEDECSICHMPMARTEAKAVGGQGQIFANLPVTAAVTPLAQLAVDGVSCAACHQISGEKLGSQESLTGGFVVDTTRPLGQRKVFGPYQVEAGLARVMRSSAEFEPTQAAHIQSAELCATCHTLYTHALGPGGEVIAKLPEQVPYLEWQHSAYRGVQSCQSCHMPVLESKMPITSVLGEPREGFSRHAFQGGNFFIPRMLSRYQVALGVAALPQELDATAQRALEHLQQKTAELAVDLVEIRDGFLQAEIAVGNLAGHKLPTAYPSRRAWLHVTIRDGAGQVLLESGAVEPRGLIRGNDNDLDPRRFEPHHEVIDSADKVQIYEAIMVDQAGAVTTGLLSGVRFAKDNRIPPEGFDKTKVPGDVAVQGGALADSDFAAGGDRVRYRVPLGESRAPYHVQAVLYYQPIAYRWAQNLRDYQAGETSRFVRYYDSMAPVATAELVRAERSVQLQTTQGSGGQPASPLPQHDSLPAAPAP